MLIKFIQTKKDIFMLNFSILGLIPAKHCLFRLKKIKNMFFDNILNSIRWIYKTRFITLDFAQNL